jgi:hypothetical protein
MSVWAGNALVFSGPERVALSNRRRFRRPAHFFSETEGHSMEFKSWFPEKPVIFPSGYHPRTLNEFRDVLQEKIPADFNRKGVNTPPFPPWIAEGISRKDIDAIMTGLGWINRKGFGESIVFAAYHTLSEHFRALNEEFLRAPEPDEARHRDGPRGRIISVGVVHRHIPRVQNA